jgi:hypothetical protein
LELSIGVAIPLSFCKKMDSQVNSKWRIAAVILGIIALSQGIQIYRVNSKLQNTFHYDVTLTFKDKETGSLLQGITTHGPSASSRDIFHQSTTYSGNFENPHISGIAYEPRLFGFSKDGYYQKDVLITDETGWELTIELEPILTKQNKPWDATVDNLASWIRTRHRRCIHSIVRQNMNIPQLLIAAMAVMLMTACKRTSTSTAVTSSGAVIAPAFSFEGEYFDTNYSDKPPVSFKAGQYHGSWPSNPGGDMNGSAKYTVRVTGIDTWELDFLYDGGGRKGVVYIRKDRGDLLIRDSAVGGETRLRRK